MTGAFARWRGSAELPIILMTAALFAISAVFAPGSVGLLALRTMLPLAGILMVASVGQSLVIQQRGIDLSGAAVISLAAVVTAGHADGHGTRLPAAIGLALLFALAAGLVNGLMVGLGLVPLVATLATYELLGGVNESYAHDIAQTVPSVLANFAIGRTTGIPNALIVSVVLVGIVAVILAVTRVGHNFVAVGVNRAAAITTGVRTYPYILAAYVASALAYAVAGVLLAGYVQTPDTNIGDTYLLAPIAIVILAGNSFGTAKVSLIASAIAALFYTQLGQFTLSLGAPASSQLYIQSLGLIALPVTRFLAARISSRSRGSNTLSALPAVAGG